MAKNPQDASHSEAIGHFKQEMSKKTGSASGSAVTAAATTGSLMQMGASAAATDQAPVLLWGDSGGVGGQEEPADKCDFTRSFVPGTAARV